MISLSELVRRGSIGSVGWLERFKERREAQRNVVELKLDVDYVVREADRKPGNASEENHTLTDFLVTQAISAKYPAPPHLQAANSRALGEIKEKTDRRIAGRVHNALGRAMNDDAKSIELTEEQFEWVHKVVDEWNVPPHWAGWYDDLLDHCEQIKMKLAEEKKAKRAEKKES